MYLTESYVFQIETPCVRARHDSCKLPQTAVAKHKCRLLSAATIVGRVGTVGTYILPNQYLLLTNTVAY